LFQASLSRSPM